MFISLRHLIIKWIHSESQMAALNYWKMPENPKKKTHQTRNALHQITFHRTHIFDTMCDSTGEMANNLIEMLSDLLCWSNSWSKSIEKPFKWFVPFILSLSRSVALFFPLLFFPSSSSSLIYQVRESMTFETKVNIWKRSRANLQFSWTDWMAQWLTYTVENECNQIGWNTISRPTPS